MNYYLITVILLPFVLGYRGKVYKLDESQASYLMSDQYRGYDRYRFLVYQTLWFNCSGYFTSLDRDRAVYVINQAIIQPCGYEKTLSIFHFALEDTMCHFVLKYIPSRQALEMDKKCKRFLDKYLPILPAAIWGTQWGCPKLVLHIPVNSYYKHKLQMTHTPAADLGRTLSVPCNIPILQIYREASIECKMNSYGGYDWVPNPEGVCGSGILDPPTLSTINIIRKSQIFCQLAVFLVYGFVKNLRENVFSQTVLAFSVIRQTCHKFARWEFSVARLDYFKLIDLILYKVAWASELKETRIVQKHQWDMYILIDQVLRDVLWRIRDYFPPNITVYLRSRYLHAHQFVIRESSANLLESTGNNSLWKTCARQHAIMLPHYQGSVLFCCIPRLGSLPLMRYKRRMVSTGYMSVHLRTKEEKFLDAEIHMAFHLPKFRNGLPYECAEMVEGKPQMVFTSTSRCRLDIANESTMVCVCRGSGTYTLIQSVGNIAVLRAYFFNHLAVRPWIKQVHQALIAVLAAAQIFLLTIRSSKRFCKTYQIVNHSTRRIHWIDLSLAILFLQMFRAIFQLSAIHVQNYAHCNLIGLSSVVTLIALSMTYFICALTSFALSRTSRPDVMTIQFGCIIYATLVCATVCYYVFTWGEYVQINCLPRNHLQLMVIPLLIINTFTLLTLVTYCFLRPYRYILYWLGVLIDTALSMTVWTTLAFSPPPQFYLTKPFSLMVQVSLWQMVLSLCFTCVFEPGIIKTVLRRCNCHRLKHKESGKSRPSGLLLPKLMAFREQHHGLRARWNRVKSLVQFKGLRKSSYEPSELFRLNERRRGYFEKMRS